MDDPYRDGQWRDAGVLPPALKRLHRRQMRAIRENRPDGGFAAAEEAARAEEARRTQQQLEER